MVQTRIYVVTTKDGNTRLIDAANASQALRYVAHATFDVQCATAKIVATLVTKGVTVESASGVVTESEEAGV